MKLKTVIAVLAALALSGCAFNSQTVKLAPQVDIAPSSEGAGSIVGLRVLDERPSQSLGNRGAASVAKGAQISTTQDVAALIHSEVAQGLQSKGFTVAPYGGEGTQLQLELRQLEYTTSTGFWTGGVHVNGAMKVEATRPGDSFDQMYRAENERRVVVVPTAGKNAEDLNQGITDLIRKVLDDAGLIRFLSTRALPLSELD
jgi:uncharacterized lipoprotein YajG